MVAALPEGTPNWDMTPYFPEPGGEVYRNFRDRLEKDIAALLERAGGLLPMSGENLDAWAELLTELETVAARSAHLGSYLGCMGAADARDEAIQAETASFAVTRAELGKVFVTVRAGLRELDDGLFERLCGRPGLREVAYFLGRLRRQAALRMPPELEELCSELQTTGLSAWSRLYDRVSGTLHFELRVPGKEARTLPVSMARTLLESPDAETRRAALEGSNAAWEQTADVAAACLNAISGSRLLVQARRGVSHFLEPAVFDQGISHGTLDVLLEVAAERRELPRQLLRDKAALLGRERLGFQDLLAPLPLASARQISWEEARERILGAFGGFHPELCEFARHAFDRRWIDWEPRAGKRPGGFCSSSPLIGESRVFTTFDGTLGDLAIVAHELGHAYHSWVMRDLRNWSRLYPMTLAETASTFAEQVVIEAVLADPAAESAERAALLDRRMQDAATFLLNIPMRFQFEKALYEERARGELPVSRLVELMCEAQRDWYGDALHEDELDPWFWASKLHFYIAGLSFYNFPYTFGYLFSLGIFARAREEGPDFWPHYKELLRETASHDAEEVARGCLGIDLGSPEFWNESIDSLERDAERFRQEVGRLGGAA